MILLLNQWLEVEGDMDLIEVSFHSCDNDFGFSVILFGLGIAIIFLK